MIHRLLMSLTILGILVGCGNSGASLSPEPAPQKIQSLRLLGGESEIITVSLQDSVPQATTSTLSLSNVVSQDYSIGVNLSTKIISFTLDNPQLGSLYPTSCAISTQNPSCDIVIKTTDNWSSDLRKDPVIQKGNIIATVSGTPNQLVSVTTYSEAPQRRIYFQNQCPYDVWLGSAGSNVSVVGCSPDNKTAKANCPTGFVCFEQNNTSNTYCIEGSTSATSFPPTDPSTITNTCKSGIYDTNTSSPTWGTCYCQTNADCGNNLCQSVGASVKQCFNNINISQVGVNGLLPKSSPDVNMSYVQYMVDTNKTSGILFGGKIYFKTGCDSNGLNCSVADLNSATSSNTPQTLSEFTLQNNPLSTDYYDVSYINGINVPIQFTPYYKSGVQLATFSINPNGSQDYNNTQAYWCTMAGGTTASMSKGFVEYNKTTNALKSGLTDINLSQALMPFACGYDFNKTNVLLPLVPSGGASCSATNPCSSGQCGLSLSNVEGNSAANLATTCGAIEGYWTYAQLCAANNSFANATYGINCAQPNNLAYSLCKAETSADAGSVRSCYNSNTTSSGQTCCGYSNWDLNGTGLLATMSPVSDVNRTYWNGGANSIESNVKPVKMACPTAYSYQFDDPYSTFNCAGTTQNSNGINVAHYKITLCPSGSGAATGFAPAYVPCVPQTPTTAKSTEFNIGFINTQTTVASVFNSANNTAMTAQPDGYYSLAGNLSFGITATGSNGSATCYYTAASTSSCINLDASKPNSISCPSWLIATGAPWNGRSITVPSQGSQCMAQTPSGIPSSEFAIGIQNTLTTSIAIYNSDTNLTIAPKADGYYSLNGNLKFDINATGGDGSSILCRFKADSNSSCIALDVNKSDANCSTWPISQGAPWTGRSITVSSQGNIPFGCVPSTPTAPNINSTSFAIGIPSDYNSTVVTDNNGTVMSNAATGYYNSTGSKGFTITTTKTSGANSGSYSCVYTLATPTSCIVGPTPASTMPPSSTCPSADSSGAWEGRNIGFPY